MPRADAVRNRERLLAAAEEAFAERGTAVPTEEVARRAGVGVGTLFRHFPTKEALLEAVFVARLQRLADRATQLSEAADPGAALAEFVTEVVEQSAAKNAFADALAAAGIDVYRSTGAVGADLHAALGTLLIRAQQTGAVRPDLTPADLASLLLGTSRAVEHVADPDARARVISVVLAGLITTQQV